MRESALWRACSGSCHYRYATWPPRTARFVAHLGRDNRELFVDDTTERAEADRRVVEAWQKANGAPDVKGAADEARARLLDMRPR